MENITIYLSVITAICYPIYSVSYLNLRPKLSDTFVLVLAIFSTYSGLLIHYNLLILEMSLGDFEKFKEIISLGALGIIWVSIETIIKKLKLKTFLKFTS